MTTIYHNPRCRKSRETLELIRNQGIEPEIILYLENTPSVTDLKQLVDQLNIQPIDLVRKQEAAWKESFKGKDLTDDQILQAMCDHPKLIERPIVVNSGRAALGRPPENVLDIL